MNILFDQGTPAPFRYFLLNSTVTTAAERGWSDLSNGDLIEAAEQAGFDAIVTTDRNLKYQQNLSARKIPIVVILQPVILQPVILQPVILQPAWPILKKRAAEVGRIIETAEIGTYLEI